MRKKGRITIYHSGPLYQVRSLAHKLGYRFRVMDNRYAGTPHLVFPSRKLMIYTVCCEVAHPQQIPKERMDWWGKQHKMDADELTLICQGMKFQGWRCELICYCHSGTNKALQTRLMEVLADAHETVEIKD